MADATVTADGSRLIQDWIQATQRVRRLKEELNGAECAASNAEQALAKWLMPGDMKPGEKIAVWHLDSLFQVEIPMVTQYSEGGSPRQVPGDPKVTIRTRGRRL